MATFNILTAHTGAGTQQTMAGGDSLFLAKTGTLNSLGADGAKSTGGDNDLQIHGTLAGGSSAFFGTLGGDLIQIYSNGTVLGGVVSAITVDGTGGNTFSNAGSVSTHTTSSNTTVIDLEGDNNHVTNTGSITANQYGTGVYLGGSSNTFNNSGSITAGTDGHNFASGAAVYIDGGGANDTTGLQQITNSGHLTALNGDGIDLEDGSNNISNTSSGVISASSSGMEISGGHNTITNAGIIEGGVGQTPSSDQTGIYIAGGSNTVQNSGSISGNYGIFFTTGDETLINNTSGDIRSSVDDAVYVDGSDGYVKNDGHIIGAQSGIDFEGGDNTLINSTHGHITAQGSGDYAVFMNDDTNTITNKGHITGGTDGVGVFIDDYNNGITNHGTIQETLDSATTVTDSYAVFAYGSTDITNDGTITLTLGSGDDYDNGAIVLDAGADSIINQHSGIISDGQAGNTENYAIYMDGGSNAVTNKGHVTGTVVLGDTSDGDSFNGAHGHFNGTIYGGDGNDAIEVGKGVSTIFGGEGADFLQAGAGHNTFEYSNVDNSFGSGADHFDTVDDFNAAQDMLNFSFDGGLGSFDSADFTTVGGAALTESNFDADIKADVGNHLHANSAVLLQISGGEFAGDSFLVVDGNGTAGYQAGHDYVVELTNISGSFSAADVGTYV